MKKLRTLYSRVPRGGKIAINLAAIALVLVLRWLFAGAPTHSLERAFRRAEAAHLVGPSDILDVVTVADISSYNRLLIADDGDGVILYTALDSANTVSSMSGQLIYREKTGGVTVVPAPAHGLMFSGERASLPVVVFDAYPDAVRAELDLHLYETGTESAADPASLDLHLTADRAAAGYFLFTAAYSGDTRRGKEVQMINDLGNTSMDGSSNLYAAFPAAVRLYAGDGDLLWEQSLVIRTRAGSACLQSGTLPDNVRY